MICQLCGYQHGPYWCCNMKTAPPAPKYFGPQDTTPILGDTLIHERSGLRFHISAITRTADGPKVEVSYTVKP